MLWKKNTNSVSNYLPSCCSKLVRPLFIFGTQIKIFLRNPRALWPSIDSNGTNMIKAQKGSKDINKIVHISGSTVMLSSYKILFLCAKTTKITTLFNNFFSSGSVSCHSREYHDCLLVLIKHIFCMTIFYIPNPTQYLHLTTTLLTINKQQIRGLVYWGKSHS